MSCMYNEHLQYSCSSQPELGDNPLISTLMSFLLTSLHQNLSLIDVVSWEVVLTNKLLVAKYGGQTRPTAEEGGYADDDDEGRVVYVEIACQPGDKVSVTSGLWEREREEGEGGGRESGGKGKKEKTNKRKGWGSRGRKGERGKERKWTCYYDTMNLRRLQWICDGYIIGHNSLT